jgi:hypothetical protein
VTGTLTFNRNTARAGINTNAPTMFHRNMKVNKIPMSDFHVEVPVWDSAPLSAASGLPVRLKMEVPLLILICSENGTLKPNPHIARRRTRKWLNLKIFRSLWLKIALL